MVVMIMMVTFLNAYHLVGILKSALYTETKAKLSVLF